jgi:hypothetical protein
MSIGVVITDGPGVWLGAFNMEADLDGSIVGPGWIFDIPNRQLFVWNAAELCSIADEGYSVELFSCEEGERTGA